MRLHKPDNNKLFRSLLISAGAVVVFLALRWLFPEHGWTEVQVAMLTSIGAWLINTLKETLN